MSETQPPAEHDQIREPEHQVGVGPHALPWPSAPQFDQELLAAGDRRNVVDEFRYWTVSAIVAELDKRRSRLQVAIMNLEHDFNIGSVVRTANAFNVAGVHIVGRRRWNRRGAMVTDQYLHVHHHLDVASLTSWLQSRAVQLVGIDNVPNSTPLESARLPADCCLIFGSERLGLDAAALAACTSVHAISQSGSTRSLNVGAAAAIAMYAWALQHQ